MLQGYINVGVATKRLTYSVASGGYTPHIDGSLTASQNGEVMFEEAEMEVAEEMALILGQLIISVPSCNDNAVGFTIEYRVDE